MSTRFRIGPTTFLTTIALWERLIRGGGPVDPSPVNTVQPFITGNLFVGETLTCNPGVWYGVPYPTFTYQWQQWNGVAWDNLVGETTEFYTPTVDGDFRCLVTGTNTHGSTTVESDTVDIEPALAAPAFSILPSISGENTTGSVLTADLGSHTGNPTPTAAAQWQFYDTGTSSWGDLVGETNITVTASVDGEYRVQVTLTNSQGTAVEVSGSIVVGTLPAPAMLETPQISGNAYVGSMLYIIPGTWTDADSFTYQWYTQNASTLEWTAIPGATGTSHDTTVALKHKVVVTAINTVAQVTADSNTCSVAELPTGTTTGQLLSNGSFTGASSTGWTLTGGGMTFTNSTADFYSTTGTQLMTQPISASEGAVLTCSFYLNAYVNGNIGPRVRFTDGTYMYFFGDQAGNSPLSGGEATAAVGTTVTAPTITVPVGKTVDRFDMRVTLRSGLIDTEMDNFSLTGPTTSTVNQAPSLDYAARIRGTLSTGSTLYTTYGVWFANPETTYSVVWQYRATSTDAWATAAGSGNTQTFVPQEPGEYRTVVTATNSQGSATSTSAAVAVTGTGSGGGETPLPAGQYTQFRVHITQNWGAPSTSLAEVQFRATVSGPAIAATGYIASTENTPASRAFDGSATTYWQSMNGDESPYVGITCAASALAEVVMTYPNIEAEYYEESPMYFQVQGWNGTGWITIINREEQARWSPGEMRTFTV